jgi:hypothetical protein
VLLKNSFCALSSKLVHYNSICWYNFCALRMSIKFFNFAMSYRARKLAQLCPKLIYQCLILIIHTNNSLINKLSGASWAGWWWNPHMQRLLLHLTDQNDWEISRWAEQNHFRSFCPERLALLSPPSCHFHSSVNFS